MTVISTLILRPNSPEVMKEFFALAKQAIDGVGSIDGVESVQLAAVTAGGPATDSFIFSTTVADWETFGKVQGVTNSNPEFIEMLMKAGEIATWETYVSQEIDFSLLPS